MALTMKSWSKMKSQSVMSTAHKFLDNINLFMASREVPEGLSTRSSRRGPKESSLRLKLGPAHAHRRIWSTLDPITLTKMDFGLQEGLFVDAMGVPMRAPGQRWGTKEFLVDGAQCNPWRTKHRSKEWKRYR